jgi:hypothetical protein
MAAALAKTILAVLIEISDFALVAQEIGNGFRSRGTFLGLTRPAPNELFHFLLDCAAKRE